MSLGHEHGLVLIDLAGPIDESLSRSGAPVHDMSISNGHSCTSPKFGDVQERSTSTTLSAYTNDETDRLDLRCTPTAGAQVSKE